MKANGVPEKIYILNHTDYSDRRILNAFTEKENNNDIEYVRKDAFIEKASEWLSKHAIKYYLDGSKFLGTDELVEDFKIAMTL